MAEHEDVDFEFNTDRLARPIIATDSCPIPRVLTASACYTELCGADHVDAIVYSFSRRALLSVPFRRLIVSSEGSCTLYGTFNHTLRVKVVSQSHAKMYLAWTGAHCTCFIGSMNAVSPTLFELMVQLDKRQTKHAITYFDELWKLNNTKK